jgi:hypothetical protein
MAYEYTSSLGSMYSMAVRHILRTINDIHTARFICVVGSPMLGNMLIDTWS